MTLTTKALMLDYVNSYLGDTDDYALLPLVRALVQNKRDEITATYEVDSLEDLPPCDEFNVITLESNAVYYFSGVVDLLGCRLHCPGVTVIKGQDSETTRIKSTGLAAGQYLITGRDTLQFIDITIESDPTTYCFDLDGSAAPSGAPVGDWYGCNFSGGNIGRIKNYDNMIILSSAWFPNGSGLLFEGSIGTVAFETSIFVQFAVGENAVEFASDYEATRRIRFNNSSMIIGPSSTGVDLPITATIPTEAYIFNLVNFSGGGTYLEGVQPTDTKSRVIESRGIENSANICQVSGQGNAVTTPVASANTDYEAITNATLQPVSERFELVGGTVLTYKGALTLPFQIAVNATIESGNNNQVKIKLYINGAPLTSAEGKVTTNGAGRGENMSFTLLTVLQPDDELTLYVENLSGANDILVEDINFIAHEL